MQPRYVELLADATKIEPAAADYLGDMDAGFYASEYLRAWAFEAQLRAYLREKFGNAWFSKRDAGSLLRELWAEGQKPTADELLRRRCGRAPRARGRRRPGSRNARGRVTQVVSRRCVFLSKP